MIELTDSPNESDQAAVVAGTRAYNARFAPPDARGLFAFCRSPHGHVVGGLVGRTFWGCLEISFLWVDERQRDKGIATALMRAAELEATKRMCSLALLDTFSFQAPGFYRRLGYEEFGSLGDFTNGHTRHYFYKRLCRSSDNLA